MNMLRSLAGWGLALFLIFMFVHGTIHPLPNPPAGQVKMFDAPGENIVFATMAAKTGIALLEPTGRVVVGILELIAALLLLVPASRRVGAVLSFLILGCPARPRPMAAGSLPCRLPCWPQASS